MTMTHIRGEPRAHHILSLLQEQYGGGYGYQGNSNHPVAKGVGLGVAGVGAAGLGLGAYALNKAGGSMTNPEHVAAAGKIASGLATLTPAYIGKVYNDMGPVEGTRHLAGLAGKAAKYLTSGG